MHFNLVVWQWFVLNHQQLHPHDLPKYRQAFYKPISLPFYGFIFSVQGVADYIKVLNNMDNV